MQFIATRFNEETDPTRPQIGEEIEFNGKTYVIMKAKAVELIDIPDAKPENEGFDQILVKQHPDRPFVIWLCWANEKK